MKTIFLADSERHVREAIFLLLEHQTDFVVVGQASAPESTLAQVCQQPPDVILLDWNLPGLHPQRFLHVVHMYCPKTIVIATSVKPEMESGAIKSGVNAFLLKNMNPEEFILALVTIANPNQENISRE